MNRDTLLGLISPRSDEELIGSVMTTFVVDGRFFEEEVLTTLSGLATGSGELGRTVSELHESLLATPYGVTVFTDARGFDGARHLGVYDLIQVPAPPTFHPKLTLTLWQGSTGLTARAVIASANLTHEGYRRNAETVVLADSRKPGDHRLIADVVEYLRPIARSHSPALALLDRVDALLSTDGHTSRRLLVSRARPLIELFLDEVDETEEVRTAIVVSPFFERSTDPSSESLVETWCRRLQERSRGGRLRACFYVPERFVDGQLVVELPISRAVSILGTDAELWTLSGLYSVEGRSEPVPRPFHGKLLALETDRRCLVLAGSANFTNAALLAAGSAANWEASVVMALRRTELECLLPTSAIQRDPSGVAFKPPQPEPPLPRLLFEVATYRAKDHRLEIVAYDAARASEAWEIRVDSEVVADGNAGVVRSLVVTLRRHPVTFAAEQRTKSGTRHFPIRVFDKENLPLPTDGPQPRGDDVLDHFAGLRTRGEFDATRGMDGAAGVEHGALPTLEHLSRFSRALFGIQDSLQRPARSVLEYRARWTGAWGLDRVIELLEARMAGGRDDPAYSLFQVWELDAALSQLALESDDRCPAKIKVDLRDSTVTRLAALIRQLEARVDDPATLKIIRRSYSSQPA